ncbi:hypothetical protein OSB04_005077 [Centaurea solstitialis]|uniref:Uncharacterized protein n=1 Tax=Centaurea solstitialis TaxID=347529 RepID=A0AA38TYC7_9ASTR|nr:hypothetical protein OSB04_005077 [Centaurea solstitialis]
MDVKTSFLNGHLEIAFRSTGLARRRLDKTFSRFGGNMVEFFLGWLTSIVDDRGQIECEKGKELRTTFALIPYRGNCVLGSPINRRRGINFPFGLVSSWSPHHSSAMLSVGATIPSLKLLVAQIGKLVQLQLETHVLLV